MATSLFRSLLFLARQILFVRTLFLVGGYTVLLILSLYIAYLLRFDFVVPKSYMQVYYTNIAWVIPLELFLLFLFGQFGVLLGYFRMPDLYRVVMALGIAALILLGVWYAMFWSGHELLAPPRSVVLGNFVVSLFALVGFRTTLRILRERYLTHESDRKKNVNRVAIAGAGDVGAQVAADMLARSGLGMRPVVFLDDDVSKLRRRVHGIPVVDSPDALGLIKQKYGIDRVIIAMPSASAKRIREIVELANETSVNAEIVPSLSEITSGRVKASRVRPVEIEDLLGRDQINLNSENIRQMLQNRVVMVTGAGGSIGSELARQIAGYGPKRLVLVEQAEIALFNLENRLREEGLWSGVAPVICNVCDEERMRRIFDQYRPDVVFHAAAHKHVPIMERQPEAAILNNSLASAKLAELAAEFKVDRFVLVSTDKAINPTSAMGASKRLAEIYLQAKSLSNGHQTRFMAVRFGNVLNSSGSVVPVFRKQIAEGGPVTVTHPEVTRFFMTIPEAVGLVLQCGTLGSGGEIFVLDMGTPVKIVDLARQMIRLSGYRPDVDIDIKFIGLRPGEKLFEELKHHDERHAETQHPRIFRFVCEAREYEQVRQEFEELRGALGSLDRNAVKQLLKKHVPEYSPFIE